MKYPQNEEQAMMACREYEEKLQESCVPDIRICLRAVDCREGCVDLADASYHRLGVCDEPGVELTSLNFQIGDGSEDVQLHVNRIWLTVEELERILNIIKADQESYESSIRDCSRGPRRTDYTQGRRRD